MKDSLPKRKKIRLKDYDYASTGAYFVTICIEGRQPLLWHSTEKVLASSCDSPLSPIGILVENAIHQIADHYPNVIVDKYAIMPDHVHLILFIMPDQNGRMISAPTISTVIGQMKRWVSRQAGFSLWQKSFVDRIIRNEDSYLETWKYIDENPLKVNEDTH